MVDLPDLVDGVPALTIDGGPVRPPSTFDVLDPATEKSVARAPLARGEDLDRAFDAALRAFPVWSLRDDVRRVALLAASDVVADAALPLADILTAEQGKPLPDAVREVHAAAAWLRYYADLPVDREVVHDDGRRYAEVAHRPIGPVAVITTWNFPLVLAASRIAPALRAGNTVVLKPSPHTPLASLAFGALLRDRLPDGVLNVLSGGDGLGAAVSVHPLARKVCFTGSVSAGKEVAAGVAPDLKRLYLGLGGNDAALVLDDADPATTAPKLFAAAFRNNGQTCVAPKRVYASRAVFRPLVQALADLAGGTEVGDGKATGTELGPVTTGAQWKRVSGLVADALSRGAVAVSGGRPSAGPGYFFRPTVLMGAEDGTAVVDEEQFGPVLPVIAFDDLDDAVTRANATHYGLGASVWSSDPDRALAVGRRLDSGMCWVNDHGTIELHLPFRGSKWSGLGTGGGLWGLRSFTTPQLLYRPN
ncbi:aldehyde dehydrogenase family protein [Streptomyces sp. MMS24-I2-30]|uniref:aldehyde dehydrogenase family protein n=1 Tax=Streptomyces sp. MMS24-I2-30 TaxID=3351564 RepID=UPI003896B607